MFVAPTSGCDAISDEGTCYSYFISTMLWQAARSLCLSWGGDLATITSLEENTLMFNTHTSDIVCWIGLNDLGTESTFVWADGNNSTYRRWNTGEPNDSWEGEDCACMWTTDQYWNDCRCLYSQSCYYCSTTG